MGHIQLCVRAMTGVTLFSINAIQLPRGQLSDCLSVAGGFYESRYIPHPSLRLPPHPQGHAHTTLNTSQLQEGNRNV